MDSKKHTYRIFNPSGCITLEAMQLYLKKELPESEVELIDNHLEDCELCSDAMEGLSLVENRDKLRGIVREINKNLNRTSTEFPITKEPKFIRLQNRLIYFGAAASIIILFGLLYFFTDLISVNNQGNIAKQIETEKQIIPPMPKAQNQVDHGQKSGQTENEPEKVQTKTVGKNIEKQTTIAQQDKSKKEINENEIRTEPSEPETEKSISLQIAQSSDSLTDQMLSEQLMDNEDSDILHSTFSGVDLASNQPLEYYLGEVFIYGDQPDLSGYNNQIRSAAAGKRESKKTTGWLDADKKELIEPKDISVSADRKIAAEATGSKEADLNTVHFFTPVDRLPEFPGGIEKLTDFLNQHLNYPSEAKRQGIQGTVLVSFIIEKDGSIDNAKIIYGIGGGCNEAALLAIESMPRWQPALKNNEPQRVVFNIPITFKLK